MKRRKGAAWAVVIFAILIMAGLIISCGDDDGGVSTAACQDACDILDECDMWGVNEEVPPNLEVCYPFCDDGDFDAEDEEGINCINNHAGDCDYIQWECLGD